MIGFYQLLKKKILEREDGRVITIPVAIPPGIKEELQAIFRDTFPNNISPRMMHRFSKCQNKTFEDYVGDINDIECNIKILQSIGIMPGHISSTIKDIQERIQIVANVYHFTAICLEEPSYNDRMVEERNMMVCLSNTTNVSSRINNLDRMSVLKKKRSITTIAWYYAPNEFHFTPDWRTRGLSDNPETDKMGEIALAYISSLIKEYGGIIDFIKMGRDYFTRMGVAKKENELDIGPMCLVFVDAQEHIGRLRQISNYIIKDTSIGEGVDTLFPHGIIR